MSWPSGETVNTSTVFNQVGAKPYSYLVRVNGVYYEAVDEYGKLTYGGSGNAGGATGTDATEVIQAAITGLTGGRTWKETVMLHGTFNDVGKILVPSYTRLASDGARLNVKNGLDDMVVTNDPSSYTAVVANDIEVCGIVFNLNGANQTYSDTCVKFYGVENLTVRDNTILNPYGFTLLVNGIPDQWDVNRYVTVEHNVLDASNQVGAYDVVDVCNGYGMRFLNNLVIGKTGGFNNGQVSHAIKDSVFAYNHFVDATLDAEGAKDLLYTHNTFTGKCQIRLWNSMLGGLPTPTSNIEISHNVFDVPAHVGIIRIDGSTSYVNSITNIRLTGNLYTNLADTVQVIWIKKAQDISIIGDVIDGIPAGGQGIRLDSDVDNIDIIGVTFGKKAGVVDEYGLACYASITGVNWVGGSVADITYPVYQLPADSRVTSVTGLGDIRPIEAHVAGDTLTRAESGSVHTNLGAGVDITLALPQDALAGDTFAFVVMTAGQQLRVDAGAAGAIYINGAKSADDAYIWADDEGESVKLVADGNGDWVALFTQGTWTVV